MASTPKSTQIHPRASKSTQPKAPRPRPEPTAAKAATHYQKHEAIATERQKDSENEGMKQKRYSCSRPPLNKGGLTWRDQARRHVSEPPTECQLKLGQQCSAGLPWVRWFALKGGGGGCCFLARKECQEWTPEPSYKPPPLAASLSPALWFIVRGGGNISQAKSTAGLHVPKIIAQPALHNKLPPTFCGG